MLRFGFVTCVQLGLSCMTAIYRAGGRLEMALTLLDHQAQQKSGRIYLDDFCRKRGIPLTKAANVNDPDSIAAIRAPDLDWLFIVGWSQIARSAVLDSTRNGVLGMHPTLLPEGRGRAAVPWTILKGLERTGVTLFKLDDGVDTGPILGQVELPVGPRETATELYAKVESAHSRLIIDAWPALAAGTLRPVPQDDSKATVWPGRKPEDGRIDLAMTLAEAERMVRAVTRPYPGACVDYSWGRIVIWSGTPMPGMRPPEPHDYEELRARRMLPFRGGALRLDEFEVVPLPSTVR